LRLRVFSAVEPGERGGQAERARERTCPANLKFDEEVLGAWEVAQQVHCLGLRLGDLQGRTTRWREKGGGGSGLDEEDVEEEW